MGDENLLLYLNLTGELFYIVAHRMKSQRVKVDLAKKVFNDLGLAICSPSRLQALISGDIHLVSLKFDQLKALMDQIAHCSIMTVNQYSLEKLFELVMIATKYQFALCQHPRDILLIILNHLDSLRRVLTDLHAIRLAEDLHNILVITYGRTDVSTMKNYLNSIRNYVQEVRLKMTNLIKLGLQTTTGEFVTNYPPDFWIHPDCVKPGHIECSKKARFGQKIKKLLITFDAQNQSATHRLQHSLGLNGNRIVSLGKSVYDQEGPSISYDDSPADGEAGFDAGSSDAEEKRNPEQLKRAYNAQPDPSEQNQDNDLLDVYQAVQGLDLCSQMLGCAAKDEKEADKYIVFDNEHFRNFKENIKSPEAATCDDVRMGINVVNIDAGSRHHGRQSALAGLAAIAKEFDMDEDAAELETRSNAQDDDDDNMFSNF
ncbi:unnamed protein product [Allacma fusca]|uniref:Protein OSCP1 n=1 Tax=Allacma fusca TaxID=39272 RepID=A0A8J2KPE3_9HEXA|nr:unnamed protein product [Allacma fusca]